MSTTIRNLLVKAGVDFSGVQKGFNQMSKDLKKVGKSLSTAGSTLTKGLTLPIVGAVAGLTALTVKSAGTADELNTLAAKTGLSTDRLQEMSYAARFIDVDLETMTDSMVKLTRSMDAAREGTKKQQDAFKQLGVEYKNSDGSLRNAKDVWAEAIDALGSMTNEAERDAIALELFGRSAAELNPLIKAGSTELNRLAKEAHDVGAVMSKENVTSLNKLNDSLDQFKAVLAVAGGEIGSAFAPVLESLKPIIMNTVVPAIKGFAKILSDVFKWFNNLSPQMKSFILLVGGLAVAMGPLLTVSSKVINVVRSVTSGIGAAAKAISGGGGIVSAITSFLGPAGLAVTVISAIVLAVGGLIIALTGGETATDKLIKKYQELKTEMEDTRKEFEGQASEAEASAGAANKLADELYDLAGKEKKTNAEKKRMVSLVEQLNEMYPDLNLAVDEQTGLLNKQYKSVKDLLALKKQEVLYAIYADQYTAALKQQLDQQNLYKEAVNNLSAAESKLSDALARSTYQFTSMDPAVSMAKQEIELAKNAVYTLFDSLGITNEELTKIEGQLGLTAEKMGVFGDTTIAANDEIAQSEAELAAATEEASQRIKTNTQKHYDSMGGIYAKGIEQNKTSLDKVNKNLRNQVDQFTAWQTDIQKLSGKVPQDVYNALFQLGPQSAPLIAELVNPKNKAKLDEFVTLMQTKSTAAKDAALAEEGIGGLPESVENVTGTIESDLRDTSQIKDAAYDLGYAISSGLEKGIGAGASALYARARTIAKQVITEMKKVIQPGSPSKVTTVFGRAMSEGLSLGILQKSQDAIRSAGFVVRNSISAMSGHTIPSLAMASGGSASSTTQTVSGDTPILKIDNFYNNTDQDIDTLAYKFEMARKKASAAIGGTI